MDCILLEHESKLTLPPELLLVGCLVTVKSEVTVAEEKHVLGEFGGLGQRAVHDTFSTLLRLCACLLPHSKSTLSPLLCAGRHTTALGREFCSSLIRKGAASEKQLASFCRIWA